MLNEVSTVESDVEPNAEATPTNESETEVKSKAEILQELAAVEAELETKEKVRDELERECESLLLKRDHLDAEYRQSRKVAKPKSNGNRGSWTHLTPEECENIRQRITALSENGQMSKNKIMERIVEETGRSKSSINREYKKMKQEENQSQN